MGGLLLTVTSTVLVTTNVRRRFEVEKLVEHYEDRLEEAEDVPRQVNEPGQQCTEDEDGDAGGGIPQGADLEVSWVSSHQTQPV